MNKQQQISTILTAVFLVSLTACAQKKEESQTSSAPANSVMSSEELARNAIRRRAIEAIIWGMPAVNFDLLYQAMAQTGGTWNQIVYWSRPFDWKNQTLTPNPDTIYLFPFINTKDVGPVVLEIPPAEEGSITGSVDDAWQTALEDVGPAGVDKGKGGKYLILPPGYKGQVPAGYIPMPSNTYQSYAVLRCAPTSPAAARLTSLRLRPTARRSNSIRSRKRLLRHQHASSMRSMWCTTAPSPTTCASFSRSTALCRVSLGSSGIRR